MDIKRNYQREMEAHIAKDGSMPTRPLLLHSCCAPCSSSVLACLAPHFLVTVFYYNPNIFPQEEYEKRKAEQIRLIEESTFLNTVEFIDGDYDHPSFLNIARGHESDAEGGARCSLCFLQRLEKTAQQAKELQFPLFCSTLTVSPHKDAARINRIGESLAEEYGVFWLPSDFKKRDGYKRSIALSRQFGLYRQDYCGCEYSLRDLK